MVAARSRFKALRCSEANNFAQRPKQCAGDAGGKAMKKHAAPIIVAILLLLPVLYAGSYLALVVPRPSVGNSVQLGNGPLWKYRFGGTYAARLFWPLERIDRTVRPEAWKPKFSSIYDAAITE
jgi:hypothetical protein